ncbi:MAG: DEAD/DEAH box helicase [Methylophaga sp.]|nr:DEAD/DEAH box helicase [Methylophaga sp.]
MPVKLKHNNTEEELHSIKLRLQQIEEEKQQLLQRQEALNNLSTYDKPEANHLDTDQKVHLFQELFKGRTDIFANRWQNSKGRSGYSVACYNEWVSGKCNKPRIKCSECAHQRYKALDEHTIYEHLSGKQVVGLYPLLENNSCHLLAADFDKMGWQDAVKAMAQACVAFNIPYALEISRSGNGAHLWIFFAEPVSAKDARALGFGLLDKAMEIHPGISFESYDRLFPNQDILPEGGFGNLIALPLQHQARQNGNSLFVNEQLQPYSGQWAFLSQLERVSEPQLHKVIKSISPANREVIDEIMPWDQGAAISPIVIENCPKVVTITLANHLYIKLDALPPVLITRLKRLASFSNPVFFKTQALRFSTHGIPRYITCARIEQGYLSLPRGCLDEAIALLEQQAIQIEFDDKRQAGVKLIALKFLGKLRKEQTKAVNVMMQHQTGVLHAPTAFGKTVTAIGIIAKLKVNTLILTHSRQLLDQWEMRVTSFLTGAEIGIIGGGKKKPSGQIDIATYQSLINKKDNSVAPLIQEYGLVIIDECHHISAPRFEMVLNEVRAKVVFGLTATPDRQDGHQKIIFMLAGPIRHKVKTDHKEKFEQWVVVQHLYCQPPSHLIQADSRPHIADVYSWIADNSERNKRIINDVAGQIKEGKCPLVLTERREHATLLNQLLIDKKFKTVILRGAMRVKERKEANGRLSEAQVIVATGKYIGEGFDLPKLDTLFLAMPISWKGTLAQYAGRIHRESEGKELVTIFDYVDSSLPMLQRMFQKREKGYKAMGYYVTCTDQNSFKEKVMES